MIRPKLYKKKSCKGSVDTRSGQVVSTRDQVVSTLETASKKPLTNMGQCVDTSIGGVDTRSASQHFLGQTGGVCRHSHWGSVSTRDGTVSTLEGFPEHFLGCFGTAGRH
ncbi:hypothetical protein Taro_013972 [Colocasia esculenta]|uniref:Uncharacterized protein n=1 Tax=Colocasia esculenta TaxID=4460 RepID=A0A843UI01_COLES|nr:hypothetical protein [Colocasia esculenta]